MTIKEIIKPVEVHLKEFNGFFKNQMKSKVTLIDVIIQYITRRKGKQVRPALVFLSAEMCGGVTHSSFTGAAMVEILHTATLVHDDVVDEASERRGMPSINAVWKNKVAVLVGDYLLCKGLLTSIDANEFDLIKILSHAVRRMSEGELLQIQKSKDFDIDTELYFKIISDKTASLMSACCEIGAFSSTQDPVKQKALRDYGENLGIAFQIQDDIFDFTGKSSSIGKPVGNDLKEKKITLPLIYAFNNAPRNKMKEISKLIKAGNLRKKEIAEIVSFVIELGGIEYSQRIAHEYSQKAVEALKDFPDSNAKNSLVAFANFVIDRNS